MRFRDKLRRLLFGAKPNSKIIDNGSDGKQPIQDTKKPNANGTIIIKNIFDGV